MKSYRRVMLWLSAHVLFMQPVAAWAQAEVLIREIVSREFSLDIGGVESVPVKEAISSEFTISVESGKEGYVQAVSREYDLLISTPAAPPAITGMSAAVSPTGETAVLDWSAYNQWTVGDVQRFDVYFSDDGPITNVTGLTPYRVAGGDVNSLTLTGLAANRDHFFAVVPVDGLGNFLPAVNYTAAYVLSPQVSSREFSLFVGQEAVPPDREVVSREYDLAVVTPAAPPAITGVRVTVSPAGDAATLDWSGYDQWAVGDIQRFDIYLSDIGGFTSVAGLTPFRSAGGGSTSISLTGLTPGADHFFAVVPVDGLGNFTASVQYAAAYVLSPQTVSRELSLFIGTENTPPDREAFSRELSLVVPNAAVPAPVTGVGSGFTGATSRTAFGAVDLDWTAYNELAQEDVARYRVYVAGGFFESVTGLTPWKTVQSGRQTDTVTGLNGNGIYHFAVVAEDAAGNFNPAVRSLSAQASISGIGEVVNLAGTSQLTSLRFTWTAPPDSGTFLQGYRVYFGGQAPVNLPVTAVSYEASGLQPGTGYPFRITTLDPFGGESGGASLSGATLLPNPANVRLTARGDEVELLWDPVQPSALVGSYAVYRAASAFTNISAATRISADPAVGMRLGSFASVSGQFYAVVAVNTLGGFSPAVVSVKATKQAQTLSFPALAAGALEIPLAATASSGLPVGFAASPPQVGTVQGAVLRVLRGGTVLVTASQEGNENFWPASATQTLRVPPVITGFTANGLELAAGTVLTAPEVTLAVTAQDTSGIEKAEFFRRPPGGGAWVSLGTDNTPGNGLSAVLAVSSLADGPVELRVTVTTPDQFSSGLERSVTLSLAPVLSMTLGDSLSEGGSLAGTVSIARPKAADLSVTLSASNTGRINPGPPAVIAAGRTSAEFTLQGRQDSLIQTSQEVRITASAPGAAAVEKLITLLDDDTPFLTLTTDRPAIVESAGANALVATLSRSPVTPEALKVRLVSSLPGALVFPAELTLPAGTASVSFPVGAVDNTLPDGNRTVRLTAEFSLNGQVISESPAVNLTIGDDEGPRLEFTARQAWVQEGGAAAIIVRRSGGSSAAALTVALSASPAGEISLPASVVIPAGAQETDFLISGTADGKPDDGTSVQLTGTAGGWSPAAFSLSVFEGARPDLVAKNAEAPDEVDTETYFRVAYRIENAGNAGVTTPFTQRVLLSKDALVGDDVLLSQSVFSGELKAGVGFERSETLRAPREAGSYYILVVTDATQAVSEILETNNISVVARPVTVSPAYEATVQTSVTRVPANTPIPLTGSAVTAGGKVPNAMVSIHIRVGGTERVIAAMTNSAGDFSTSWQPLPGEGGDYEIGAAHPGLAAAPTQDTFVIFTIKTEFPTEVLTFDEGSSLTLTGTLTNPNAYPVTALTLAGPDLPAGLTAQVTMPGGPLAAGQSRQAGVALTAAAGFHGDHTVNLRLTSGEGVTLLIPLKISVRQLVPQLVVNPSPLKASVLRGTQKTVQFTLENQGAAASGPVELLLPDAAWIRMASPGTLPSIPPGQSASVTLLLEPPVTQALTAYKGAMVVAPAVGRSFPLPFEFRVVSNLTGDLKVEAVDEYFYFTAAAPKLAGARVTLRDAVSAEEIATVTTPAEGAVTFPGIPEGWYALEVTADKHAAWKGNLYLNAGEVNFRQVFLSLETVSYSWKVEEIELQDRYKVTVETTFETNVPAPVVTVTPPVLEVGDLTVVGQTKVINFTLENHGWIAANQTSISFPEHPLYEVTPLIGDIGTLPAKSSITIPVRVRLIADEEENVQALSSARGRRSRPCAYGGRVVWDYICGPGRVAGGAGIPASGAKKGDCDIDPEGDGGGGAFIGGGHASAAGGCVSPDLKCLALAAGGCIPVLGCFFTGFSCSKSFGDPGDTDKKIVDCAIGITGCLWGPANMPVCYYSILSCLVQTEETQQKTLNKGAAGGDDVKSAEESMRESSDVSDFYQNAIRQMLMVPEEIIGSSNRIWIDSAGARMWFQTFQRFIQPGSAEGNTITPAERAQLMASPVPQEVNGRELERIIDRWNRTMDNLAAGITSHAEAPAGANLDFIDLQKLGRYLTASAEYEEAIQASGVSDPVSGLILYYNQPRGGGVCAQVKIRLDQEAVMTRSAFRGTLELENRLPDNALAKVAFDLAVQDSNGADARDLFNIQVTKLTGLAAIDGTGEIAPQSTGSAQWTLIPRDTAAPLADTVYTVGGTIRYDQGGTVFSIPVTPVRITVKPDAALYLKYFHQRDVISDDPHTDPVEPSVPYALAVMVENRGAGAARALSITSAQPQIVENEKGLLIDFKVIGTEVAGQNLTPSLTADFGNVDPGQRKVGTWLLTSSLQGLFIDYKATFQHLDGFGDSRLSLIKDVEIHEMIRLIEAQGALADGLPDFLVNDIPDLRDFPDTVHLSNGTTAPVKTVETAAVSAPVTAGRLSVTMQAAWSAGWNYLRVPDPGNGGFRLLSAVRADGRVLPLDKNVWLSDRTFIGLGRQPIRENILHLVDEGGAGAYTLTYGPRSGADTSPPSSQVATLPAQSGVLIPVRWSGTDDQGVAAYDVFVRMDTGAWQPWLTGTTRTSAVYEGQMEHRYAFYSRATDLAGNVQPAPADAQASTLVSLTNSPPTVAAIPAQTFSEGASFDYQVVAADADGPAEGLSYAVSSSLSGLVIHPASGRLSWVTGVNDGGRSGEVTVTVTDSGVPAASAQTTFRITVLDTNRPPVVAPIASRTLDPGETLRLTVSATDPDVPAQTLAYTLAPGSPAGLAIDSVTGILSWTPPAAATGKTHAVKVLATDNGTPAATASAEFSLSVRAGLAPVVGMTEARLITARGVFLQGAVDPGFLETRAFFEIAKAGEPYAAGGAIPVIESPLTGGGSQTVTAQVTGLLPHTAYRFRLPAENAAGLAVSAETAFTTANTPPAFGGFSIATSAGQPAVAALADILAKASDADGDSLSVIAVSAVSARGAQIALGATTLTYTPPPGLEGTDSFSVFIQDGFGEAVNGVVSVEVTGGGGVTMRLESLTFLQNGAVSLLYSGVEGRIYTLQRSTDLLNWTDLRTLAAPASGSLPFVDNSPPRGQGVFYRIREDGP